KDLTVASITAKDIQMFYAHELKTVSPNTVIHEHANIHRALKYALKMDLIDFNPADKVDRPKKQKFIAEHYSLEELEALFDASKNHYLGLLIQVTAFYGLRRSETLGLRWDAIDFENKTITIKHILTTVQIDGKQTIIKEDRAKTKSSLRSLPLVPRFEKAFKELKEQQEENRRVCGKSYCTEYIDYIFVNGIGKIYNPNSVTEAFGKLPKENGLRKIRFHDLRHSCASLLLANGVSLKEIQEWLGHSDIATTADIYSHLDFKSKISSAYLMDGVLNLPEPIIKEDWGVE
ncbi:MAG: site-specific integrase, partial [Ruminococcus sp.]|nr:site-specific integrase [Ruminococcus sp.]